MEGLSGELERYTGKQKMLVIQGKVVAGWARRILTDALKKC